MREPDCFTVVLFLALLAAVIVGASKILAHLRRVEESLGHLRDAVTRLGRREERAPGGAGAGGVAESHDAPPATVRAAPFLAPGIPIVATTPATPAVAPAPSRPIVLSTTPSPTTPANATLPAPAVVAPPSAPGSGPAPSTGALRAPPPAPIAAPEPAARPVVPPAAPREPQEVFSLERFLGGRVLLILGVIAVLFGLGYFFKLAIERAWIGPGARLAIGVAAGAAALVGGDRIRARGLSVFGQALMGAGVGALFLSDHFASVRYGFISQPLAFVLAAAVAALAAFLAISRSAPFLAWLGFVGAYLSPALLGRNQDALEGLTLWLSVVGLGLTVVLWRRPWSLLDLLPIVATWGYYLLWRNEWFAPHRADVGGVSIGVLTATLVVVAVAPALLGRRAIPDTSHAARALAIVGAVLGLHDILFPERRYEIGAGLAVLGLAFAGVSALARRRSGAAARDGDIVFIEALALVAVAVPFLFGGNAVVVAWAAFGAALVFAASRTGGVPVAAVGLTAIACSLFDVLVRRGDLHSGEFTPFVNADFVSALAPAAALAIAWRCLERGAERLRAASTPLLLGSTIVASLLLLHEALRAWMLHGASPAFRESSLAWAGIVAAIFAVAVAVLARKREEPVRAAVWAPLVAATVLGLALAFDGHRQSFTPALNAPFAGGLAVALALFAAGALGTAGSVPGFAAVAYLFLLLTTEIYAWGEWPHAGLKFGEIRFRVQVAVSVAWTVYAAALVATGFWRNSGFLRWSGIVLFLVTVAKVFLVDLDRLETVYRVGSFLVLGVLLLAISFLYQRARKPDPPAA